VRGSRWPAKRLLALLLMGLVWVATGTGVYLYLGSHRSVLASQAKRPGQAGQVKDGPLQRLPGTLYLVQDGTLYRLLRGTFTPLLQSPGGAAGWSQPAVTANGQSLVVVRRDAAYSDLYLVSAAGNVQSQLTHDANPTVELNHWALYPRLSPDGGTLFFSYDPKDRYNNYNVVLAVWSAPLGTSINPNQMRKWTTPQNYAGGDLQPVPLASGAVLYTKYALQTSSNKIMGQVWMATRAGVAGRPLTQAADDCSQPSLSPDGQKLAMICTGGKQLASIVVAAFDGTNLGPPQVVASGQLTAQPTWAPDSASIVYLAAQGISGHFQLWQQRLPQAPPPPTPTVAPVATRATARGAVRATPTPLPTASPTPTATPGPPPRPVQLTTDLDFDATSSIAWHA
jgi:hypothetical protein